MLRFLCPLLLMFAINAHADDAKTPAVERKALEKHDLSGVPGKEVVTAAVTFPPGAVIGFHTHPGDEVGYILKGSATLKTRGSPDKALKAGDSFFNVRGAVHSVVASTEGVTILSSWIVDKDVPMSTPVP